MKLLTSIQFAPYFRDYLISSLPRVCRGCFFHLSFPPKKLLKKGSSVVLLTTSILKVTSKDMSCFEIGFTTQVLCLTPLHGKSNSLRSDAANHQIQICYGKKFTLNGAFSQFYELFCAKRWRYVPGIFPKTIKLGKRNLIINSNYIGICREISHSSFWIEVQWLETHPVLCVIKIRALVTFYLPWQQRLQKKLIIKQKSLGCCCYCCCAAAVAWEKILANFWLGSYFSDTIKEAN